MDEERLMSIIEPCAKALFVYVYEMPWEQAPPEVHEKFKAMARVVLAAGIQAKRALDKPYKQPSIQDRPY